MDAAGERAAGVVGNDEAQLPLARCLVCEGRNGAGAKERGPRRQDRSSGDGAHGAGAVVTRVGPVRESRRLEDARVGALVGVGDLDVHGHRGQRSEGIWVGTFAGS